MQFIGDDDGQAERWRRYGWFPVNSLGIVLSRANPNLEKDKKAFLAAHLIFEANDSGNFEDAWQALKEALEYGIEK